MFALLGLTVVITASVNLWRSSPSSLLHTTLLFHKALYTKKQYNNNFRISTQSPLDTFKAFCMWNPSGNWSGEKTEARNSLEKCLSMNSGSDSLPVDSGELGFMKLPVVPRSTKNINHIHTQKNKTNIFVLIRSIILMFRSGNPPYPWWSCGDCQTGMNQTHSHHLLESCPHRWIHWGSCRYPSLSWYLQMVNGKELQSVSISV